MHAPAQTDAKAPKITRRRQARRRQAPFSFSLWQGAAMKMRLPHWKPILLTSHRSRPTTLPLLVPALRPPFSPSPRSSPPSLLALSCNTTKDPRNISLPKYPFASSGSMWRVPATPPSTTGTCARQRSPEREEHACESTNQLLRRQAAILARKSVALSPAGEDEFGACL